MLSHARTYSVWHPDSRLVEPEVPCTAGPL